MLKKLSMSGFWLRCNNTFRELQLLGVHTGYAPTSLTGAGVYTHTGNMLAVYTPYTGVDKL